MGEHPLSAMPFLVPNRREGFQHPSDHTNEFASCYRMRGEELNNVYQSLFMYTVVWLVSLNAIAELDA